MISEELKGRSIGNGDRADRLHQRNNARTTGITGYEAAGLVRSLVTKGFLYEPERRNPRFLAAEYEKLEHSAILRIKKSENCFLLRTKKEESLGGVVSKRGRVDTGQKRKRCLSAPDRYFYLHCQYGCPNHRSSGNHCYYPF